MNEILELSEELSAISGMLLLKAISQRERQEAVMEKYGIYKLEEK